MGVTNGITVFGWPFESLQGRSSPTTPDSSQATLLQSVNGIAAECLVDGPSGFFGTRAVGP